MGTTGERARRARRARSAGGLAIAVVGLLVLTSCTFVARVSAPAVAFGGPNGNSFAPSLAENGDVLFATDARNLGATDTNAVRDIFRADGWGQIRRVSLTQSGAEIDGPADRPSVDDSGDDFVFDTTATNLLDVDGLPDTNGRRDVYRASPWSNDVARVSWGGGFGVETDGASSDAVISGGGEHAAFTSAATNIEPSWFDGNGVTDIYRVDLSDPAGSARRVSRTQLGSESDGPSRAAAISDDGQRVAFESDAGNLLDDIGFDGNGVTDVFVYDEADGSLRRVSVASDGTEADGPSTQPAISGDGRYVAFTSTATNLVGDDVNGVADVFVHDLDTGTTVRVTQYSTNDGGGGWSSASHSPAISDDGRYVAVVNEGDFTQSPTRPAVVRLDRDPSGDGFGDAEEPAYQVRSEDCCIPANGTVAAPALSDDGFYLGYETTSTNTTGFPVAANRRTVMRASDFGRRVVSRGPYGGSYLASISDDGGVTAFYSNDAGMVPGDANDTGDAFVRDNATGVVQSVNVSSSEEQGNSCACGEPAVSGNGRFVAFASFASNLVPGDTNNNQDVFVRDLQLGTTERVSLTGAGVEGNGDSSGEIGISDDGRYVAFESEATNLVGGDTNGVQDIFVRDRQLSTTTRVSVATGGGQAGGESTRATISGNGQVVAFQSGAPNLVAGDTNGVTDVFVHDRVGGATTRVSVSSAGAQGNGESGAAALSDDGNLVAFDSVATNLVAGDTNGERDVFTRNRATATTTRVSVRNNGSQNPSSSDSPSISDDGRYVAFAGNGALHPSDTNSATDAYVRDRIGSTTTQVSVQQLLGQLNSVSFDAVISGDGRWVAYATFASNADPANKDRNDEIDVYLTAAIRPTVTGVAPASAARGGSVNVSITGTGFQSGASLLVSDNASITVSNVVVVNATTITATIAATNAAVPGARNLVVSNPGGGIAPSGAAAGSLNGGFTVT